MAYLEYKPTSPLFHYCGPQGFKGIIESGALWLSDLRHANDPKELKLVSVIEALLSSLGQSEGATVQQRAVYKALASELERLKPRIEMFSFSLSLKGDLLPMWQEYTDRGRGYCIGFRATAFNDMSLRIQKVSYISEGNYKSLPDLVEAAVHRPFNREPNQVENIQTLSELLSLASAAKDESWQHEEEIRLTLSSSARPSDFHGRLVPIGLLPDGRFMVAEEPLYRERDGVRIPYHRKYFGRWELSAWRSVVAISEVVIGPNNIETVQSVSSQLADFGYRNFDVRRSKCTFR